MSAEAMNSRPAGYPRVSVTVVLYNSDSALPECLHALRPALEDDFAELIAVDNASPDGSAEIVEHEAPGARLVRSETNRGFAGGANLAWPYASGDYWLLLNPDAALDSDGLRELVSWMDQHPELAAASPAHADGDGAHPRSVGRALPSAGLVLLELFRLHRVLPRKVRARVLQGPFWKDGDNLHAGWVPGTAMLIRRRAIEEVGLLDESFFLYGEDLDWCWRMRRAGWRIGANSSVAVRHTYSKSSFRTFGTGRTYLRGTYAECKAIRKWRGPLRARLYALAQAVFYALESIHPRRPDEQRDLARRFLVSYGMVLLRPRAVRASLEKESAPRPNSSA